MSRIHLRKLVWKRLCGFLLLAVAFFWVGASTARAEVDLPVTSYTQEERQLMGAYEQGSIIRLHVLAEDDTPQAQRIKLAVRDAVLAAFSGELQGADEAALYELLQNRVDDFQAVAEKEARRLGFEGNVTAEAGILHLPEKQYGRVILPEGQYRALRITLGKGEGQNWWCVLYPSLCLAVAGDDPWQAGPVPEGDETAPQEDSQTGSPQIEIVWDSQRIWTNWMLWP